MPNVPAGCYQGADGRWLMVTLVRDAAFVTLCQVLSLAMEPRFDSFAKRCEQAGTLVPLVPAAFATRDRGAWLNALQAARILCSPVNTPNDWLADPHVLAEGAAPVSVQGALGAVPFPVLPGLAAVLGPAPLLGQHTAEVLASAAEG